MQVPPILHARTGLGGVLVQLPERWDETVFVTPSATTSKLSLEIFIGHSGIDSVDVDWWHAIRKGKPLQCRRSIGSARVLCVQYDFTVLLERYDTDCTPESNIVLHPIWTNTLQDSTPCCLQENRKKNVKSYMVSGWVAQKLFTHYRHLPFSFS